MCIDVSESGSDCHPAVLRGVVLQDVLFSITQARLMDWSSSSPFSIRFSNHGLEKKNALISSLGKKLFRILRQLTPAFVTDKLHRQY